jgi:hypothetical protein
MDLPALLPRALAAATSKHTATTVIGKDNTAGLPIDAAAEDV